ncbi:MAG: hypothetical protein EXR66_06635 [Dehalococcoidia bacterium]|nr:hypothetical protein [Dehalococcoidia bacterium]
MQRRGVSGLHEILVLFLCEVVEDVGTPDVGAPELEAVYPARAALLHCGDVVDNSVEVACDQRVGIGGIRASAHQD